jgi:hypothetical protein
LGFMQNDVLFYLSTLVFTLLQSDRWVQRGEFLSHPDK